MTMSVRTTPASSSFRCDGAARRFALDGRPELQADLRLILGAGYRDDQSGAGAVPLEQRIEWLEQQAPEPGLRLRDRRVQQDHARQVDCFRAKRVRPVEPH